MKTRNKQLTYRQYFAIEEDLKTNQSYRQIAEKHSVSHTTVYRIYQKAYERYIAEHGAQNDN